MIENEQIIVSLFEIFIGLIIGAVIGWWIAKDAQNRGANKKIQRSVFVAGLLFTLIAAIAYHILAPKRFNEKDSATKLNFVLVAIIVLIIGLVAGFIISTNIVGFGNDGKPVILSKDAAGKLVVDWLAASEVSSTLLVVNDENGMYRVTVKSTDTGIASDLYITKDGAQIFQPGVTDVNQSILYLTARRQFFECLASKGVLLFGSTETNATLSQLQQLGGTKFVDKIYVGCEGANAQLCINASVTEVPTFFYNNNFYTGVRTADWLINLTGC